MLSHDEQPAMAAAMATATQILERDAIFMMRLLFLSPGSHQDPDASARCPLWV
ncbi:hypothetical protein AXXA_15647 [Achromobacter insuavis AXX-A]|uniref:Uncharacterized protein n=1 Tax=Achromobacter insuavis AXX-A TaxID=1003200 RepID=F7T2G7_9BURK|nr:hypothetical protein AXXA_15647 [Achromobacter insuavis AXX-A]